MDEGMTMAMSRISIQARKELIRPMSRKDIFYSGSVMNLPEYQSQRSLAGYRQSVLSIPQYSSNRVNDVEKGPRKSTILTVPRDFRISRIDNESACQFMWNMAETRSVLPSDCELCAVILFFVVLMCAIGNSLVTLWVEWRENRLWAVEWPETCRLEHLKITCAFVERVGTFCYTC